MEKTARRTTYSTNVLAKYSPEERAIFRAAESPFIKACKTREDVELAAGSKITDERWARMVAKANANGVSVGENLSNAREESRRLVFRKWLNQALDEIFLHPDGSPKSQEEFDTYIDALATIQDAEAKRDEHVRALKRLAAAKASAESKNSSN